MTRRRDSTGMSTFETATLERHGVSATKRAHSAALAANRRSRLGSFRHVGASMAAYKSSGAPQEAPNTGPRACGLRWKTRCGSIIGDGLAAVLKIACTTSVVNRAYQGAGPRVGDDIRTYSQWVPADRDS